MPPKLQKPKLCYHAKLAGKLPFRHGKLRSLSPSNGPKLVKVKLSRKLLLLSTFRFPGQQHRIAHCQVALIEQLPGTFCDHLCHRSHFGSKYSWGRCGFAVLSDATALKSLSKALSKV